jgi:hypothetical protein
VDVVRLYIVRPRQRFLVFAQVISVFFAEFKFQSFWLRLLDFVVGVVRRSPSISYPKFWHWRYNNFSPSSLTLYVYHLIAAERRLTQSVVFQSARPSAKFEAVSSQMDDVGCTFKTVGKYSTSHKVRLSFQRVH